MLISKMLSSAAASASRGLLINWMVVSGVSSRLDVPRCAPDLPAWWIISIVRPRQRWPISQSWTGSQSSGEFSSPVRTSVDSKSRTTKSGWTCLMMSSIARRPSGVPRSGMLAGAS